MTEEAREERARAQRDPLSGRNRFLKRQSAGAVHSARPRRSGQAARRRPRPAQAHRRAQSPRPTQETNLMKSRSMLVLGLMSGTSADAIDVAVARVTGAPPRLDAKLLGHTSISFPPAIRKEILRVAQQQTITAAYLSQLNFRL